MFWSVIVVIKGFVKWVTNWITNPLILVETSYDRVGDRVSKP